MPMYVKCTYCGSDKIIPGARLEDDRNSGYAARGHAIYIASKPNALFFQGIVSSPVRAFICRECGYTALFANNPKELYQAYKDYQTNQ